MKAEPKKKRNFGTKSDCENRTIMRVIKKVVNTRVRISKFQQIGGITVADSSRHLRATPAFAPPAQTHIPRQMTGGIIW